MKRLLSVLLLFSLAAAACGDDKEPSNEAAPKTGEDAQIVTEYKDPGTATSSTTATTAPQGGGTTSTSTATGQGGPGSSTTTTRAPFPVELKIGKGCVRRGKAGDTQTLEVKTRPKDMVGYSTEYSDHSNELSRPEYKDAGGSGYGEVDDKGVYKAEWKVPDTAPSGIARLHVIADGRIHSQLTFKVVGPTESC